MLVNLEATRQVMRELGDDVWVRGALSGPFSLALNLVGTDFFMCCITDPDQVKRILRYCTDIIKAFGKAYIDVGADVILFDSAASPDMLSPKMFADFVQPYLTELVGYLNGQGVENVPLIIGGNTTRIIGPLIDTGANNLLCDFTADWEAWSGQCREHKRALRRNIDPGVLQKASPVEVFDLSREIIVAGADLPGFIMGTAVVPYGTPTENLLAVREACYAGWPEA
jgi:uroporphyrinogen decarboxylase